MSDQPRPKPQRGCFFYGCLAGTLCLVILLVLFLVFLHFFKKGLNQYTDTKPMPLPALQMTPAQIEEVRKRFESFKEAASAGRPTAPLELSADDINALIASAADLRGARDKLYVTIRDGQLQAQVSLPLDKIGLPFLKGRYLNGTGIFAVSLQNGLLNIAPVELLVKGRPLPSSFMDKIRNQNFAAGINEDSRTSAALNRLQTIEIHDGKLAVVPKQEKVEEGLEKSK
jgi:hypothetical protein